MDGHREGVPPMPPAAGRRPPGLVRRFVATALVDPRPLPAVVGVVVGLPVVEGSERFHVLSSGVVTAALPNLPKKGWVRAAKANEIKGGELVRKIPLDVRCGV